MAFTARPDSQVRVDAAQERKTWLSLYQMVANDPNVVRVEILKTLFEKYGYDSSRLIVAQLPDKGPEPPKISFALKGEELNPGLPEFPLVLEILRLGGYTLDPKAVQQAQLASKMQMLGIGQPSSALPGEAKPKGPPPHGGAAEQVSPLGKHTFDQTGERSGPKPM
jgi:hypothetical protein